MYFRENAVVLNGSYLHTPCILHDITLTDAEARQVACELKLTAAKGLL